MFVCLSITAVVVMACSMPFLALSTTYSTAARLLKYFAASTTVTIPVVQVCSSCMLQTVQDMVLVGAVLRADLEMAVQVSHSCVLSVLCLPKAEQPHCFIQCL
jgi:hypothetical protein